MTLVVLAIAVVVAPACDLPGEDTSGSGRPFAAITLLRQGKATSQSDVTIGSQPIYKYWRYAISTVSPNVIEFPVVIPENAALRIGFAVIPRLYQNDIWRSAEPVEFAVEFAPDEGAITRLFEKSVDIRGDKEDRVWHRHRLDLSQFAGRRGRLRLVNTGAGMVPISWGRPTLFDARHESGRPNLLFILVDALRADHLGCYGYERPTSPNLDALARDSIRYDAAFTNAPMTVPSLPQILTSRYVPDAASPTLTSLLHIGGMPVTHAISNNPFLTRWMALLSLDNFDSISVHREGDRVTDAALHWIDDVSQGDRFALYLHYLDVHSPYAVPQEYAQPFIDPAYQGEIGLDFGDTEGAQAGRYSGADRQRIIDLYDGEIRYVDYQIGRLLDGLEARGLLDSTLVILTADHGEELWDHGSFFHGQSLYDEQLHVPLLIRVPGRKAAGTVVNEIVRTLDLLPTIADVLGMPDLQSWEGESLLEATGRPRAFRDRVVFARASNPGKPFRSAVRTRNYKLIVSEEDGTEELFHLPTDPGEMSDVSEAEEHAAGLEGMRARLDRYADSLQANGVQVRARSTDGAEHRIDLLVESANRMAEPGRIRLSIGERLRLSDDQRTLRWTGAVGAEARGFRFYSPGRPDPAHMRNPRAVTERLGLSDDIPSNERSGELRFEILVDGAALPAEAIRLRGGASVSTSSFECANEPLLPPSAIPARQEVADFPVIVSIWCAGKQYSANITPEQFDKEERDQLRVLGYGE